MADPFFNTNLNQLKPKNNSEQPSNQDNSMNQKVKKGAKLSVGNLLLGCGIFSIIIIGIVFGGLFYAISNPSVLNSMGIGKETVKSLLRVFSLLFFGLIFFISFGGLITNGYRTFTSKTGKIKFIIGGIFSFIGVLFGIGVGTYVIFKINELGGDVTIQSNKMVVGYLITKDQEIITDSGVPLIAPASLKFQLNKVIFESRVLLSKIDRTNLVSIKLDCGNDQVLNTPSPAMILSAKNYFPGECMFLEKTGYKQTLIISYKDTTSGDIKEESIDAGIVNFTTQIKINIDGGDYKLNSAKDEILLGDVPVNAHFDARNIFTDLKLADVQIKWDVNDDNKIEFTNIGKVDPVYSEPKLYKVSYNLPKLKGGEKVFFTFKVRSQESKYSACNINITAMSNDKSLITLTNTPSDIKGFSYKIIDNSTNKILNTYKETSTKLSYSFQEGISYKVEVDYITDDGTTYGCTSNDQSSSFSEYKINYQVEGKGGEEKSRNRINLSGGQIYLEQVPYNLKINIKKILPEEGFKNIVFNLENEELLPIDNIFDLKINEEKTYNGKFIITNNDGKKFEEPLLITVKKKPLIGDLKITPDTGEEPLETVLDASSSVLNDKDDEIIYFTWNFGDGEIKKNISQGRITHSYKFDLEKNNGEYSPSVTIKTKKGFVQIITGSVMIKRAVKKVAIKIDSHPTQIVKIGDTVNFSIEIDGLIKNISWDFGNDKKASGEGRQLITTSSTYDKAGLFTIRVNIDFQDAPAISSSTRIKVIEPK